jgi:hypothetical protein
MPGRAIQKRLGRLHRRHYQSAPESLAHAGRFFGLDPKKSRDREQLLFLMADAIFGPPAKKGRRRGSAPSWPKRRLIHLGGTYNQEKHDNPKLSNAKIAEIIIRNDREFKYDDPEQVRQRLPLAHELFLEWAHEQAMDYMARHPEEF